MGRMKKMVGLLSLTALLTIAMSVPAFAAKKIKEVSISVVMNLRLVRTVLPRM